MKNFIGKNLLPQWLLLLGLACLLSGCYTPALNLRIVNKSGSSMAAITVNYKGGPSEIGPLSVDEYKTIEIAPTGDTSISLNIFSEGGSRRNIAVPSYIAPGFHGTITITLKEGMTVDVADDTRV